LLTLATLGAALLAITWIAYPAAVVLVARALAPRRPSRPAVAVLPSVTCVLATRDDPEVVRERVANFLASNYPSERLDVVVGLDATSSTSAEALWSTLPDPRVRVVSGDAPGGKGATLNAAVRSANGELLVFSDARQRFEPDTIRRLVDALHEDERLGAVSGRLLLPRDEQSSLFRQYLRYELAIRSSEAHIHSAVGVSGSVYAMRRPLWPVLPVGVILDDLYVPMRLVLDGWRVGFADDAIAYETRRVAAAQEYRRKVRTLTGNFQLCAWLPACLMPHRNPIWLQFVCHKLLRLLTPWGVAFVVVGVTGLALRAAGAEAPKLLAAAAMAGAWPLLGRDRLARKLRGLALQLASLLAATVTATVNAARTRWDVWAT
jgi:cellulose synthase/poly-beta-1,6-N-acetylglucosamine synthase-like glycosyltransferase